MSALFTASSWSPSWVILLSVFASISAVNGRDCLRAHCSCEGHNIVDIYDPCGCRCVADQDETAIVEGYKHTVCTEFDSTFSCCADDKIEAEIEKFTVPWVLEGYGEPCREVWTRFLCGLYCDSDLGRSRNSFFIKVIPEPEERNFLFGYRACKLEEIEGEEPAEGSRGLDQAAPDYVYPFLPLVNGLGVCDTYCFQVDTYCGISLGSAQGHLERMQPFRLPISGGGGGGVTLTAPYCNVNACHSNLGGLDLSSVTMARSEELCAEVCSDNKFKSINPALTPLPLASVCATNCNDGILDTCPITRGAIEELVRLRWHLSDRAAMCAEFDSKECADACGLTLSSVQPWVGVADPSVFCGSGCKAAAASSSTCSVLRTELIDTCRTFSPSQPPPPSTGGLSGGGREIRITPKASNKKSSPAGSVATLVGIVAGIAGGAALVALVFAKMAAIQNWIRARWHPDDVSEYNGEECGEGVHSNAPPPPKPTPYWEQNWEAPPPDPFSRTPPGDPHSRQHAWNTPNSSSNIPLERVNTPSKQSSGSPDSAAESGTHSTEAGQTDEGREAEDVEEPKPPRAQSDQKSPRDQNSRDQSTRDENARDQKPRDQKPRNENAKAQRAELPKVEDNPRAKAKKVWRSHLAQWNAFCMNTPRVIGYGTVPFLPVTAADGLDFSDIHLIASFLSYPEVNELNMLWHPDKFTQYFGDVMYAPDRADIMAHVTEISSALNVARRIFKERGPTNSPNSGPQKNPTSP